MSYLTRFWAYTINSSSMLFWREWDPISKSFTGTAYNKAFIGPTELAVDPRGRYLFVYLAGTGAFMRVDTNSGDTTQVGSNIIMSITSRAKYHPLKDIVYGFWGANIIAAKFSLSGHTTNTYSMAAYCSTPNDLSLSADGRFVFVACNALSNSSLYALAIDANGDINTTPVWQNSLGSVPSGSNSMSIVTGTYSGDALLVYSSTTNKLYRLSLQSNGAFSNATIATVGAFAPSLAGGGYNVNQTLVFGLTSTFQITTIDTSLNLMTSQMCGGSGTTGLLLLPPFDRLLCSNNSVANNLVTYIVENSGILTQETIQSVGALGLTKLFLVATPK